MRTVLLFLTSITLHAEAPRLSFEKVTTVSHGDVIVERFRASEGTEQIWLIAAEDPAKRHLLYTHHRQAEIVFSEDNAWLAINDHAGSAGSSLFLFRRKEPPVYEQVADLTDAAWKFFDERNGLKTPAKDQSENQHPLQRQEAPEESIFDHRSIDAVCWAVQNPPTLLIRLRGHLSGPDGILNSSQGWYCLYDIVAKSFHTDLNAVNNKNTRLGTK